MKKKSLIAFMAAVLVVGITTGCSTQSMTKSFGGTMTLKLPLNQKLEGITWKDDSLWYLTRPIREGEEAETWTFTQSSEFGMFEGEVIITEFKTK